MIQAKELRIGNWVHFDNNLGWNYDYIVTPRMMRSIGMGLSDDINIELNGYHRPIPITEEWLLSFGFKKDEKSVYISPYETAMNDDCFTRMCFDFVEDKMFVVNSNAYDGFHVECVHVHQLQNLYFALTGTELECKEI